MPSTKGIAVPFLLARRFSEHERKARSAFRA